MIPREVSRSNFQWLYIWSILKIDSSWSLLSLSLFLSLYIYIFIYVGEGGRSLGPETEELGS